MPTFVDRIAEIDEAIGNARATLRVIKDREQREEVEDYLDNLLDQRSELAKAAARR